MVEIMGDSADVIKTEIAECCLYFQAEDGIRGAQESRGLGDVYKRQIHRRKRPVRLEALGDLQVDVTDEFNVSTGARTVTVSYTHLTLPTIHPV